MVKKFMLKVVRVVQYWYYIGIVLYTLMLDPNQKKAALESELQQIAKNYQEAQQVMQNCEKKIYEIRGGIAACDDLIKTNEEETT